LGSHRILTGTKTRLPFFRKTEIDDADLAALVAYLTRSPSTP
jgi:hypothetical protein